LRISRLHSCPGGQDTNHEIRQLLHSAIRWATYKESHRTNSTFGFCQRKYPKLKKPKELFFATARTEKQSLISKFETNRKNRDEQ